MGLGISALAVMIKMTKVFFDEVPLRLTASGHDFLEAIRNKEVWATLKSGFKDASIGTLVTVSKKLLNRALTKQLDKYFD